MVFAYAAKNDKDGLVFHELKEAELTGKSFSSSNGDIITSNAGTVNGNLAA